MYSVVSRVHKDLFKNFVNQKQRKKKVETTITVRHVIYCFIPHFLFLYICISLYYLYFVSILLSLIKVCRSKAACKYEDKVFIYWCIYIELIFVVKCLQQNLSKHAKWIKKRNVSYLWVWMHFVSMKVLSSNMN